MLWRVSQCWLWLVRFILWYVSRQMSKKWGLQIFLIFHGWKKLRSHDNLFIWIQPNKCRLRWTDMYCSSEISKYLKIKVFKYYYYYYWSTGQTLNPNQKWSLYSHRLSVRPSQNVESKRKPLPAWTLGLAKWIIDDSPV